MKPIETHYNGYRFRSRLEARWAVFFDSLGVEYEYEPEGFELDDGTRYLPDFKVKCYGCRGDFESNPFDLYIEIKGEMTEKDAAKIRSFAEPIIIFGPIPNTRDLHDCVDSYILKNYDRMDGVDIYPFNYETVDGDHFAAYPAATKDGHFYLMGDDSNYINYEDLDRILLAYEAARKARFEFER